MNKTDWQQTLLSEQATFNANNPLFIDSLGNAQQASNHTFVTPLLYQGLLSISGNDANKFLQGQLTCDINRCTEHQSVLGAACNPQGRMYSSFRIIGNHCDEPGFLLRMRSNLIQLTHETLHKYSVFFKVELKDASNDWLGIGLWGTEAEAVIKQTFNLANAPQEPGQSASSDNAIIVRLPGKTVRFECWIKANAILDHWQSLSTAANATSNHAWLAEDIQQGIGEVSLETESAFTPHMLNFQAVNAISFDKGCYTGQEIVARTHYKGQSKRHMQHFKIATAKPLSAGTELQDTSGKTVATVVSLAHDLNDSNSQHALLVINKGLDNGSPLELQAEEQPFLATPQVLPYSLEA